MPTTILSKIIVNKLLDLLPHLTDKIKNDQEISDNSLIILLQSVDLESNEKYINELKKWSSFLKIVKENPLSEDDVITALKIRGVPEANATIAVQDIINSQASTNISGTTIKLNVASLEFGEIIVGNSVTREVEIIQGNGKIENLNEFINVSSTTFKKGDKIKITAEGGQEGLIYLDNVIRFYNDKNSVDLRINAQWITEKTTQTPPKSSYVEPPITFFDIVSRYPENIERDPFETSNEYISRIKSHPWVFAGEAYFTPDDYNMKNKTLFLKIVKQNWAKELNDKIKIPEQLQVKLDQKNISLFYYSGKREGIKSIHRLIIKFSTDQKNNLIIGTLHIVPFQLSELKIDEIINSNPKIETTSTDSFLTELLKKYERFIDISRAEDNPYAKGLFETNAMYKERLRQMGLIKAGKALFDKTHYNVELGEFPYSIKFNDSIGNLLKDEISKNGVLHLNRDVARRFWAEGNIRDNTAEHGILIEFTKNLKIKKYCIVPYSLYQQNILEIRKIIESPETNDKFLQLFKKELHEKANSFLTDLQTCCPIEQFTIAKKLKSAVTKELLTTKFIFKPIAQLQTELKKTLGTESYISVFKAYTMAAEYKKNMQKRVSENINRYEKLILEMDQFFIEVDNNEKLSDASLQKKIVNKLTEISFVNGELNDIRNFLKKSRQLVQLLETVEHFKKYYTQSNQNKKIFESIEQLDKDIKNLERLFSNNKYQDPIVIVSKILNKYPLNQFRVSLQLKHKLCPFCGNEISAAVVKCKHCKKWLTKDQKPIKGIERIIFLNLANQYYLKNKVQEIGTFYTYFSDKIDTQNKVVIKTFLHHKLNPLNKELLKKYIKKIGNNHNHNHNQYNDTNSNNFIIPFTSVKNIPVNSEIELFYFEYPYIKGINLDELKKKEKNLSTSFLMKNIFSKLLNILNLYYENKNPFLGYLHPKNIFITENNSLRITPGLRYLNFYKRISSDDTTIDIELPMITNLRFISPEILDLKQESQQSDIYSLGVILYELESSKKFDPANIEFENLDYADIIRRCVAKEPKDRWNSITELQNAIKKLY